MLIRLVSLFALGFVATTAHAQSLLTQVDGIWAIGSQSGCARAPYEWRVETAGSVTMVFRDRSGHVNRESVDSQWDGGFTTTTIASPDVPIGTPWSYTLAQDGSFLVRNLRTRAQFVLMRCAAGVRPPQATVAAPRFDDPVALVSWLLAHSGRGFDGTDDAASVNVFSPGLRAAIRASLVRAQGSGDMPCGIDADIILGTQDEAVLAEIRLVPHPTAADRVTVDASFALSGSHVRRAFLTVFIEGAWKVENIMDGNVSFRRALTCS